MVFNSSNVSLSAIVSVKAHVLSAAPRTANTIFSQRFITSPLAVFRTNHFRAR